MSVNVAVIGYVTIYNDESPYDGTHGITTGPDGNIWFTAQNTGRVGRIKPDGSNVVEYSTTYGDTRYIAPGPDGALWFTEHGGAGAIGRITTAGVLKEYPIPTTFNGPWSITAGPDGNMWFTEDGNKIGRITMSGKITEYPIPTPHALPDHIAAGPDGQLWFSESTKDKLASISTTGHIREFQLPSGSSPSGVVTGPDGHLWITEQTGPPGKIAQVTVSGSKISLKEYTVPDPQSLPYNIIVGPDKNLWFTDPAAGGGYFVGRLGRMTTSGVFTMFDPKAPYNKSMIDLTAGPGDGRIWYGLYWSSQVANMVAK
jgi:virginiamycin B lyase